MPTWKSEKLNSFLAQHGLSGSVLKLIAVITMVIDHVGLYFLVGTDLYLPCRYIGRLSFPIFAFLIAEGLTHTRDIKKYFCRLVGFAIVSEIPVNLVLSGTLFSLGFCNVFFTFSFAALPVLSQTLCDEKQGISKPLKYALVAASFVVAGAAGYILKCDYSIEGIALVWVFYYLREMSQLRVIAAGVYMALLCFGLSSKSPASLFALIFIFFYNGERGFVKSRGLQLAFYAFYPVHFAIIWLISEIFPI